MEAPGRFDDFPPPLHGELSVNDLAHSGSDFWAVGMRGAPGPAIIAHSTGGEAWQVRSYSGSKEGGHTQLAGLHATAGDDVWAVGWVGLFHTQTERTHIVHFDGTTFRAVPGPDFGVGSHLSGVAAWGGDDAFAVGARTSSSTFPTGPLGLSPVAGWKTLAARWDGHQWAAAAGPGRGTLADVCAVGAGAYWAVGTAASPGRAGNTALLAHYAHEGWQQVGFEGVGTLFAVSATGPDDVWAVGQDQDPSHVGGALILHFDGHAWAPVEVPVAGQAWLSDVACSGREQVWAVGAHQGADGAFRPLILHFDGTAWASVDPPVTAARQGLTSVVPLLDGAAWVAAGASVSGDTGYAVSAS